MLGCIHTSSARFSATRKDVIGVQLVSSRDTRPAWCDGRFLSCYTVLRWRNAEPVCGTRWRQRAPAAGSRNQVQRFLRSCDFYSIFRHHLSALASQSIHRIRTSWKTHKAISFHGSSANANCKEHRKTEHEKKVTK